MNFTPYTLLYFTLPKKEEKIMTGYATKEELAQIRGAMSTGFAEVRGEMARLRGDLEVRIVDVRTEIAGVKSDVVRWMFALFVTTLLAILGLYFKK
jgi:hypothetical protein